MVIVIKEWFRRYFSDPEAVFLFFLLLAIVLGFMYLGKILAPVVASIVLAYLLEWPVQQLMRFKFSRTSAVVSVFIIFLALLAYAIFDLLPLLSEQISNLIAELPTMINRGQTLLMQLPDRYPGYISVEQLQHATLQVKGNMVKFGQFILSHSLSSIPNLILIGVYLVLVPLLVFFFLKDQKTILAWFSRALPNNRTIMQQIWRDINRQLGNYVRGKVFEIIIVGLVCYITFMILGLQYAALLSVLVGLSVLVPFIGAIVVTVPVLLVGFVEWGWSAQFIYLCLAYIVIITLDANVLVPLLFSEAVNLHPIAIIIAILGFGGIWGFWGVFFAIPLASVVKAILEAWPVQRSEITQP